MKRVSGGGCVPQPVRCKVCGRVYQPTGREQAVWCNNPAHRQSVQMVPVVQEALEV